MISFVVPVYNARATLETCIRSIQAQDVELEIILIDDGSGDGSGALCDEFAAADDRIRVMHKPNGGVSSARNDGINMSRGEYIAFVDADDRLEPGMAAQVLTSIADRDDIDMVVYGVSCDYIDTGISVIKAVDKAGIYIGAAGKAEALALIDESGLLSLVTNKLYRRELFMRSGVCFEKIDGPIEDGLLNLAIYRHVQTVMLMNDVLYHYVQYNMQSMVRRYFNGLFDMCRRVVGLRCALYSDLGMDSERYKDICAKANFLQDLHGIKNMYMRPASEMRAERLRVWKYIFASDDMREEIARASGQLSEARIIRGIMAPGSPRLADMMMGLLMSARRRFKHIYSILRDRVFFRHT